MAVVSSADAFFLNVERTGAAQHVGGVVVLEPADQRPTIDEIRKLVAGGFARLPRMHQRLAPVSRWRRPRWIEAERVDLDWHVIEHRSADGRDGLLRLVGDLAERPMPRDRPLWRIVMVRDVGPGGADALVVLLHHSIADGIGTILQTLSLFEPRPTLRLPVGVTSGWLARTVAVAIGLAQLVADGATRPLPRGRCHPSRGHPIGRRRPELKGTLGLGLATDPQLVNASALANHVRDAVVSGW